jgi:TonB family protein
MKAMIASCAVLAVMAMQAVPAQAPPPATAPPAAAPAAPPPPAAVLPPGISRLPRTLDAKGPEYPAAERRAGTQGSVTLEVVVRKDGTTGDVAVAQSSGSPGLDSAAIAAARTWRFEPALGEDGQPVDLKVRRALQFKLEGEAFENPMTKRCSAITAEVAAYLQANPGQPARRAPVFSTTAGLLLVAGIDRPAKDLAQWYRTLPAVFDDVLKQCAEKPDATMQDVLPAALKAGRAAPLPPAH